MSEKQERILIVDDEEKVRKVIHTTLSREGYRCQEAASAEQALEKLKRNWVDLVILDIIMPKVDGFEVYRWIREWSQVPIIMLSGRVDESDKVKCQNYCLS